ncbi:Response regulator receiver domain-containing protein [Roseateles sp. YR242]|nr:Response regulator receiver domain-containing protein [Roseateles sp. YR242]
MYPAAMSDASATRHVLYVEDDRINIVLMEEVFRLMPGWTLHIAETGGQALEMLPRVMPTLVLMDMNLPDMNGLQLMGHVRADARLAGLRCVALSADVMDDQRQRARAAGFQDYWLKPIDVRKLRQALERL